MLLIICIMLYISNAVLTWVFLINCGLNTVEDFIAIIILSLIPPVLWIVIIINLIKVAIRRHRKQKQQDLT